MANLAEKEEQRLKPLIEETEGQKVQPITVVRHSFKPRGTAEQAWRAGETEEEMIAKKMKELQMKAKLKEMNKGVDPAWKKKEQERLEKEKHLQSIQNHPLASKQDEHHEAEWKGQEEMTRHNVQSQPTTPVHTPVKVSAHSQSQPTTPVHSESEPIPLLFGSNDKVAARKREEERLRAHFLAVHEDKS